MTVIKVENLGKQYRLGQVGTGTISHDLNRWWAKVRGKEDPYLKVGETNDRTQKGNSDLVWALKDINFEVKQGEVLGIIGRNGAGKSTLLKILSRVTGPTVGDVKVKGRIASLLEVGTGFHPELTGRENIFLNGAILGMSKQEINSKFDEIVDFSGVERYIDTPVKRYSSGMYVRLAFAVAAHLEPEILIVDEVLAVGDAEFQKKCLGKMKDVSGQGRTVLFVSHNMASVKSLCAKALLLENGGIKKEGDTDSIIEYYRKVNIDEITKKEPLFKRKIKCETAIIDFYSKPKDITFYMDDTPTFFIKVQSKIKISFTIRITIFDLNDNRILALDSSDVGAIFSINENETREFQCELAEALNIKNGQYRINLSLKSGNYILDHITDAYSMTILEKDIYGYGRFSAKDMAIVLKKHKWQ